MPPGGGDRGAAPRCGGVRPGCDPLRPLAVTFQVPVDRAFAYLADPRNRPEWQASLRAVDHINGATWTDVTVVPGLRPRMRETLSERPRRWAEEGRWGPFRADLALTFEPGPHAGTCRVAAAFVVRGLGLGAFATACARPAIAADLRRAARTLMV